MRQCTLCIGGSVVQEAGSACPVFEEEDQHEGHHQDYAHENERIDDRARQLRACGVLSLQQSISGSLVVGYCHCTLTPADAMGILLVGRSISCTFSA